MWFAVLDKATKRVIATGGPVLYPEDDTQEVIELPQPYYMTDAVVYWHADIQQMLEIPPA